MQITIQKLSEHNHFEAENEDGGKIRLDANNSIGGLEGGISPLQLLLAGVGTCSAVDVLNILEKQRQDVQDLKIEVNGDKQKVKDHSEYKIIDLKFILKGDLDEKKVERAVDLSINKYCSVSKALEKGSEIRYSFEINE